LITQNFGKKKKTFFPQRLKLSHLPKNSSNKRKRSEREGRGGAKKKRKIPKN
jgi:hypothetical protein